MGMGPAWHSTKFFWDISNFFSKASKCPATCFLLAIPILAMESLSGTIHPKKSGASPKKTVYTFGSVFTLTLYCLATQYALLEDRVLILATVEYGPSAPTRTS